MLISQILENKHQAIRSTHVKLEEQIVILHDQIEVLTRQNRQYLKQQNKLASPQHTGGSSAQPQLLPLARMSSSDAQLPVRNFQGLIEDSELHSSATSNVPQSSTDSLHVSSM